MLFETWGDNRKPAVLFFHAMGVTGKSSEPIAKYLCSDYFCILPTSTVYCKGQKYRGKEEEIRQTEDFLQKQGVRSIALLVASSLGADLAIAFLAQTRLPVGHIFFDGGQFAQIGKMTRRAMTPFLYLALKSISLSKGKTVEKIIPYADESVKPYFLAAAKELQYGNLRRQLSDSLENKPFPPLPETLQAHSYFVFGSAEDHYKYRDAVMQRYPHAHFPVLEQYNHMQYQIQDPKGFSAMLRSIAEKDCLPPLSFWRK